MFFKRNTSMPVKALMLILLIEAICLLIVRITGWPNLLSQWDSYNYNYNTDLVGGILALITMAGLLTWWLIKPGHFHQFRQNALQTAGLLFLILFIPVTNLLILVVATEGLSINPLVNQQARAQYLQFQEYQFYVFMAMVIFLMYKVQQSKKNLTALPS